MIAFQHCEPIRSGTVMIDCNFNEFYDIECRTTIKSDSAASSYCTSNNKAGEWKVHTYLRQSIFLVLFRYNGCHPTLLVPMKRESNNFVPINSSQTDLLQKRCSFAVNDCEVHVIITRKRKTYIPQQPCMYLASQDRCELLAQSC